jgi:hypothetical protein
MIATTAGLVGVLVLVLVGAILAARHEWPFPKSSTSRDLRANSDSSAIWKGPREGKIRPPEEIWSGDVSLVVNRHYGLNEKTVKALNPCGGCFTVGSAPEGDGMLLKSEQGILVWPKMERPSYLDCVHQRESGTLDAIALEIAPHDGGLAVNRWLCATGKGDIIVRLQYEGRDQNSKDYRFAVTAWNPPFVAG